MSGEFDGGPMIAVDLDGDGTYEFEIRDNAFFYAFGCYACSEAPLQVLALENGKIRGREHRSAFPAVPCRMAQEHDRGRAQRGA